MNIGDAANDVLPFETMHRMTYFHSVVDCGVENKLSENISNQKCL